MDIIKKIAKLIDVKSLVTLTLTVVFSYLSIKGTISGTEFLTIFATIIAFFFGKKTAESDKDGDKNDNAN